MKAEEALQITKSKWEQNKATVQVDGAAYLEQINKDIIAAAEEGKFATAITIPIHVQGVVATQLEADGYTVRGLHFQVGEWNDAKCPREVSLTISWAPQYRLEPDSAPPKKKARWIF